MEEKIYSISEITGYINWIFENDKYLKYPIYLRGEISNFKAHSKGHLYFTLKDKNSRISAIMFKWQAQELNFVPEDGMTVLVKGHIKIYKTAGTYQIYIDEMKEDGLGALYLAYKKLEEKLQKEGLFDESHKKSIPNYPFRIGVITAPTGAAVKDIMSTINRRWPLSTVLLFPTLVQGEGAKDDIVKNIERSEDFALDLLIIGRGGGSIEDLWAFNEEIVARAIYECSIPIISAVGHETDFTISDFVADLRAPTPTGAAEMGVPQKVVVLNYLNNLNVRLNENIKNVIKRESLLLKKIKNSNIFINPRSIYQTKAQNYLNLFDRVNLSINNIIKTKRHSLDMICANYIFKKPEYLYEVKKDYFHSLLLLINNNYQKKVSDNRNRFILNIQKLEVMSPLKVLKRGYSITKINDKIIKSTKDVKKGDILKTKLNQGNLVSKIIEIEGE